MPTSTLIRGSFEARVVPPPPHGDCAALFCTAGTVSGGIAGSYRFAAATMQPSGAVATISFFTGRSDVTTDRGTIVGIDTGTIDMGADGGFASLITFTGGTGAYEQATGQIRLRGRLDQQTGTTAGDYDGTIATP